MSDSSHATPGQGDPTSLAYFLFLSPAPIASAEERLEWDISRWSTRPYRLPYPSTRWPAYDNVHGDSYASPESTPFDRSSSRSMTDSESQQSEPAPLTPTLENFTLDETAGIHVKPEDDVESDQDQMFRRVRHGRNSPDSVTSAKLPVVHQLSKAVLGKPSNVKGMGYVALMSISVEDVDNPKLKSLIVELLADTCSDLAWSLGANPCKIAYYDKRKLPIKLKDTRPPDDSADAEHTRVTLTAWTDSDRNEFENHTKLPHPLDFRTYADWQDVPPEFKMRYADSSEGYMIGRESTITLNAYDAGSDSVRRTALNMRWAIAYAVNLKVRQTAADGVLALSLYDHQNGSRSIRVPRRESSFLYKLQKMLPPCTNDFIIMYFTVRPHPSYFPGKRVQSWVAFNGWPTSDAPTFSEHIPVHRNAYKDHWWSVTLLRIEFLRYDEDTRCDRVMHRDEYPGGLEVLVDSGSSTSELPYRTINGIHTAVFQNTYSLPTGGDKPPTYHIPSHFNPKRYRVRLVFEGEPGEEDVAIFAPFSHFVCARDLTVWPDRVEDCPWQGVIFAGHRDTPFGVLGVNFFQTMHISFHKGRDGINYLRMSTQQEDVQMYRVRTPPDTVRVE